MEIKDLIQEIKRHSQITETNIIDIKKINGKLVFEVSNGADSRKPKNSIQSNRGDA